MAFLVPILLCASVMYLFPLLYCSTSCKFTTEMEGESEGEREREREKDTYRLLPICSHKLGMRPDWELNPQPIWCTQ